MAATQHLMTDGLVVREYPTIAETDRFIAILTRDKGLIRAAARGAKNVKSRSGAGTQLLSYAKFSLIPAKDKYIVEDAAPQEVFFSLRQDLEKLALGQYFCELALHLTPSEAPAEEHLRLLLNALHFLSTGERPPLLIKAVTELHLLSLEGYMPDLTGCARCGKTEDAEFRFSPVSGSLTCSDCPAPVDAVALTGGVLTALRAVLSGGLSTCFSFTLPPEDTALLATVTERFLLAQVDRTYSTLEFYHTLH